MFLKFCAPSRIAAALCSPSPAIERLENRRHFSTAVSTAVLSSGVLKVTGTSGDDVITLVTVAPSGSQPQKIRVVSAGLDARFPAASVTSILVNAGGGADVVDTTSVNKPTVLNGGAGNDNLRSGPASDALQGGDGDDTLDAGTGSDFISGGAGIDRVNYTSRSVSVNVSLDNVANDGQAGEKDDVRSDVEEIAGGSGNDTLTGDKDVNTLLGNGGNDKLFGGDGNDFLDGGAGADQLYGQGDSDLLDGGLGTDFISGGAGQDVVSYALRTTSVTVSLDGVNNDGAAGEKDYVNADVEGIIGGLGNDTLTGNAGDNFIQGGKGDDLLKGGDGNDVLIGNAGKDRLYGQGGNDTLYGNDGEADYLDGGLGLDKAQKDSFDALFSVETIL